MGTGKGEVGRSGEKGPPCPLQPLWLSLWKGPGSLSLWKRPGLSLTHVVFLHWSMPW